MEDSEETHRDEEPDLVFALNGQHTVGLFEPGPWVDRLYDVAKLARRQKERAITRRIERKGTLLE